MAEKFSTSEFLEVVLKMHPVPPGTKSTRYASGHRYDASEELSSFPLPEKQPPEKTVDPGE
jgi:hypothetical protein